MIFNNQEIKCKKGVLALKNQKVFFNVSYFNI